MEAGKLGRRKRLAHLAARRSSPVDRFSVRHFLHDVVNRLFYGVLHRLLHGLLDLLGIQVEIGADLSHYHLEDRGHRREFPGDGLGDLFGDASEWLRGLGICFFRAILLGEVPVRGKDRAQLAHHFSVTKDDADLAAFLQLERAEALAADEGAISVAKNRPRMEAHRGSVCGRPAAGRGASAYR